MWSAIRAGDLHNVNTSRLNIAAPVKTLGVSRETFPERQRGRIAPERYGHDPTSMTFHVKHLGGAAAKRRREPLLSTSPGSPPRHCIQFQRITPDATPRPPVPHRCPPTHLTAPH